MVVERNHRSVDSVLVSKPVEPAIKIDSISIDLINADEKTDAVKCEHFSIRGYVSEIRKRDWKICWPFSSDGDSLLPPLHAPNFRFWRCQNCLWKIGAKATANGYGPTLKSCGTEYTSNGICSCTQVHGDAAMLCSDFQQAPTGDIHEGRKIDTDASCHLNSPAECPPFSYADERQNKSEASNYPIIGNSMGSEDNLEQDNLRLIHVTPEAISSLMQKTNHIDETAFKSKASGSTNLCRLGCVNDGVADAECAGTCKVKSAAEIKETGNTTYMDDQHIEIIACGTFSEARNVDEALSADKGQASGHPSLKLYEVDHPSSESDETMIGNKQESDHEDSSHLHRRKTRKMRLLTELLDGNGNRDAENIGTEGTLSNAIPNASAEVNKFHISQGEVPLQRKIIRRGLGQNRKRKLPHDENWILPETSFPNKMCREVQILKRDVETTDAVVGSKTKEDACARLDLQPAMKCHLTNNKRDRNPIIAKKKNKKALIFDEFLSFSSSRENMANEIEDGLGDIFKGNARDDVLVKPAYNAYTGTEIDLFPLPSQTVEGRPSKGKMLRVDDCQDPQIALNHGFLSEVPATGNDAQIMHNGSLAAPFHVQDASNELNLSLNCYMTTQRCAYEHSYVPQVDRRISFLNCQEGASKDQVMSNSSATKYVGNFNFTSKSAQDALFGKGLHGEMNSKRTTYKGLQDASHENGLNLSLNSYFAAQRYEGNHAPQVGDRRTSLLNWPEGTSEDQVTRRAAASNYIGNFSVVSKLAVVAPFGTGFHSEQSDKRATCKMPLLNEKQNCPSQFEIRNRSLMQQKDICSASSSGKTTGILESSAVSTKSMDQRVGKVCEQGALDDIPMEIVELMAKNQYERCLPDADYDKGQLELTNNKSGQMMDFSKVYGYGELNLFQQETAHKQSPQAKHGRNGIMRWGENMGPTKHRSVDYFSQADRNQFKLGHLEKTHTPAGLGAFLKHQEKPPSGVQYSVPSSSRQNNSQNCKWFGDLVGKRSSHTSLQASGPCNMCQNIPHQSKEANHLWSSMMPNHMSFVYSIPQKSAGLSSNMDVISHSSGGVHKENTNRDLDPKFVNPNAANLGKQNRDFGSQMLGRTCAEYPFAGKHSGIEPKPKPVGSLDLYSNETIPAMHLLSLMDAGLRSSAPDGMDVAPRFLKGPSTASDHGPKELHSGAYKATNSMKHPRYDYHGKNQLAEKLLETIPAIQTTAYASGSSSRRDKIIKKASDFSSQVFQKQEKWKVADPHTQSKGCRLQQYASPSGGFGTNCGSLPVHSMQKILLDASDYEVFPLNLDALENSAKHKLQFHGASRTAHPQQLILDTEICSINRNPTDFSIPEAGNVYTIAGEDLKFRKPYPCTNGSGSIKLDGHMRQRKLHAVKEHGRHLIS